MPEKVLMQIEASILDELVRAGLGHDHLSVVSNSLQFSRCMKTFADLTGHVSVRHPNGGTVSVHAFDVSAQDGDRSRF